MARNRPVRYAGRRPTPTDRRIHINLMLLVEFQGLHAKEHLDTNVTE
jgi:hypothetical protein